MKLKVDLQFFAGEKTEKASPKKRQDTRKKGQVAKSQEVNTAVTLLTVFLVLNIAGPSMLESFIDLIRHSFQSYMHLTVNEENIMVLAREVLFDLVKIIGPILAAALAAGVASNFLQIGFLFSAEAIQFKLDKIDPIKGFKRIISLRALVELIKSILKISFVGLVTFWVIWQRMDEILILTQKSAAAALAVIADITGKVGLYASAALLFLSFLDYLYQKYDYEKNIRMSKQDLKDEYKNIEGDPLIKSKIKQKQRDMAMSRMMQEVPNADVVITNPTHFAIALKYDEEQADAPLVLAKGVDFIAQKIKQTAKDHDIIMVENRPLARALYDQTEIGQAIPEEFFKAVAEILAYVYKTNGKI